jgi:hypothetical protein
MRPSMFGVPISHLISRSKRLSWPPMNTKELLSLSTAKLKRMVVLKAKIERLQSQLEALATSASSAAPVQKAAPRKRTMSAAARRKISLAAKARWAKIKAAKSK